MSFVQGQLRRQPLSITFATECACCAAPLELTVDADLRYRVAAGEEPIAFLPLVDFAKLEDPSIIDAF